MKGDFREIPFDKIVDPQHSLRNDLSPESVEDLVQSIKQIGIIEPIVVRKKGNVFEIVAGQRRTVAAEIAGLTSTICKVVDVDDQQVLRMTIHENIARTDISAIEWANHLATLKKHLEVSNAKLAKELGMSEGWVEQKLAILQYSDQLKEALGAGLISASAANELSRIKNPNKLRIYTSHAARGGVSPALAKRWRQEANRDPVEPIQSSADDSPPEPKKEPPPPPELCTVCSKGILPEEATTLTVHKACLPN